MSAVIKIIIGLFIWFALPEIFKKKVKNKGIRKFISLSCMIVGVVLIIYVIIGVLETIK